MKTPIEILLDQTDWQPTNNKPSDSDLPYATHSGVFEIGGQRIRCYRLNTGQAVFHADDVRQFFGGLIG